MSNKESSYFSEQELRVLYIFEQLNKGGTVSKTKLSDYFGVAEKTVRRDIDKVRRYYEYHYGIYDAVAYSRAKGGYIVKKCLRLSNNEIYALIKMLIENRTFNKMETQNLCEHLLNMGSDDEQVQMKKLIRDERLQYENYAQNRNRRPLLNQLWELANHIQNLDELEIRNRRQDGEEKVHLVYPVGITFSEYYFYLIVYYKGAIDDNPRIFRVDRILYAKPTGNHFEEKKISQYKSSHFDEKLQFMYSGNFIHLQFRFWGDSIDAVMDRLPNATSKQLSDGSYMVRAHVYSKGIKMWLLSQMEFLEVIEPQDFREEMAQTIRNMANLYNK